MDAYWARRRWRLHIACACIALGGWTAGAVRAEAPVAEGASARQSTAEGKRGVIITTEGGLAHQALAGMTAFNPPIIPPDVPPAGTPPPSTPDNPLPPDTPVTTVYPPDMPPDTQPTTTGSPEPGGFLMGLIGSLCTGAAVWRRRLAWLRIGGSDVVSA
ncbi:MAG TPA: hypothetical protein VMS17_01960 [Gemmataceae bacterium]|nr:hypothetical protein [Gemmataceae bacterium]